MGKSRHFFPGGNTSQGFYSFYHYLVKPSVKRKYILKGGPGVGKSHLMKQLAAYFLDKGQIIEYHWCSSDPDSLDGIVIGAHQAAVLDGTAPHLVDPRYPGAVDEIIDLGRYWQRSQIATQRPEVIEISDRISFCFSQAYHRLKESYLAWDEWSIYPRKVRDERSVSRNILGLTKDFLQETVPVESDDIRHLFAGAITPAGKVLKVDFILESDTALFAVKGSPGSGVQDLLAHVVSMIKLTGLRAEIYHNPFDPLQVDMVYLPDHNRALLDVSDYLFPYTQQLASTHYRRQLDFDQLLPADSLSPYAKRIALARERLDSGIQEAVEWIEQAKHLHDQLEGIYIDAMDFPAIDQQCEDLILAIEPLLND